jgi:phospholipid transport system substrate-binding protein
MFKTLVQWGVIALSLTFASLAQGQEDPYGMIQDVANKTFKRINTERPQIKQDPEVLRKIMEQELLPYIDYKFSALKVLGKYYKKVPREKFPEYLNVFRTYLVTTYAIALSYYDDQEVTFQPAQDTEGKKAITVRAIISDDNRPDINLSFKLRKNRKTNEWKAYDMVAEGISMLSSKQSEFEPILRKEGVDAVIALMREAIAKPLVLEDDSKAK